MAEVGPSLMPSAVLMAMREESVALALACAFILFAPTPANAAGMLTHIAPQGLFTSPVVLPIMLAGIFYAATVLHAVTSSFEAIEAMVAPTFTGVGASATGAVADATPTKYKDWLAGRPLPTMEELTDACVLIASGPQGHWAMCAWPKDATCEADETFSAYYGQPVYVCPM